MKKAVSAATSAALLASLLATAVAPSAFAAITVGSAGNVPVGGTSANNVSFQFTEQAAASIATNGSGSFTVTILDSTSGSTVTFSGTPSVAGSTGSLGASASLIAPNVLQVKIGGSDILNIESIFVTGLKIKASSTAALGAIQATMGGFTGSITGAAVFSGGGTATGYISSNQILPGATSVAVTVSTTTCPFTAGGTLAFATSPESVAISAVSGLSGSQQTLTIGAVANTHFVNEAVSETTACVASTTLASPGTVVAALTYNTPNNPVVYPGENNSPADNLVLVEPSGGFLPEASTVTYKIATPGVVFSSVPSVVDATAGTGPSAMVLTGPVLSADRTSVTITVSTVSATGLPATITLYNILYDVASTVPTGTYVSVGVTTSGGLTVLPASNTNAVVFRGVIATAPSPTVYIGENNQTAGIITFTETQAGFFTAGTGTGTNVFSVCPAGVNFTFTVAPYAQVVGGTAAGNLILRDGNAASATNLVQGIVNGSCYTWYVWTASTTASTIKIGGVGLTSGPLINVTTAQAPGGVDVSLYDGNSNNTTQYLFATVQFATAVYRNQVAVTALSQPRISAGTTHGAAGNIQIAETGLGQLKAGESICFEVLWKSGDNQDQFLNGLYTADLPVATASGTGLVIGPVNASQTRCQGDYNPDVPAGYMQAFAFPVLQQSTAGDGKVVISNISYTALTGGVDGPVQLSVWGMGGTPTNVIFHSTVTNAVVGANAALSIGAYSALGLKPTSGYTTKTPKTQATGKYVTWKFTGGTALAGQRVNVLVAKKVGGVWGGPKYLKSAWADANGIVTFAWTSKTVAAANVRVQWPGGTTYVVSTSKALGAYFK